MSKQCEVCGKTPLKAAKLTFSHKQIVHRQTPNLQTVRVNVNGNTKKMTVCTSCLKAGKVQKAV
ncbi:50S ribosomal protein L28 [bacterium]|nr:50S ribosomal protein L28 [bacterium]